MSEINRNKKSFYKKWWFWLIIVVVSPCIVMFFVGMAEGVKDILNGELRSTNQAVSEDVVNEVGTSESTTKENDSNVFIKKVREVSEGAIGVDEKITNIVLENANLCVYVDLNSVNPAPLTIEDIAISRNGSITDAILGLKSNDDLWETITVDFGDVGKIVNNKRDIKENEFGGRYFPSEKFKLQ